MLIIYFFLIACYGILEVIKTNKETMMTEQKKSYFAHMKNNSFLSSFDHPEFTQDKGNGLYWNIN